MTYQTLAMVLVAVNVVACSSDGDGGGEGGGGGTVEPGATLDLFACGVAPDCVLEAGHLGDEMTPEQLRCSGELAVAGEGGAILWTANPGPYPTSIESLVVFGPDGTAWDQTRTRCGEEGACEGQNTTAWKRTELRRCVIDVDPAEVEGCGTEDGVCAWSARVKDCVEVESDWTCADLPG